MSSQKKSVIKSVPGTPPASGPYSRVVRFENTVYVSGLSPRNSDGTVFRGTIEEEVSNVLENISKILAEAGSSLDKVLKVTVILDDSADWTRMNSVYKRYFVNDPPARTTFQSKLDGAKIEMDVIAHV